MEDIDLYRSAAAMIKKHGEEAAIEAALKSDAMLKKGDMKGAKIWREVVKKIDILQAQKTDGISIAHEHGFTQTALLEMVTAKRKKNGGFSEGFFYEGDAEDVRASFL